MRGQHDGAAPGRPRQVGQELRLRVGVQACGWFVEQQDVRRREQDPCQGQPACLADGKAGPRFSDPGIQAVRQAADEDAQTRGVEGVPQ